MFQSLARTERLDGGQLNVPLATERLSILPLLGSQLARLVDDVGVAQLGASFVDTLQGARVDVVGAKERDGLVEIRNEPLIRDFDDGGGASRLLHRNFPYICLLLEWVLHRIHHSVSNFGLLNGT